MKKFKVLLAVLAVVLTTACSSVNEASKEAKALTNDDLYFMHPGNINMLGIQTGNTGQYGF